MKLRLPHKFQAALMAALASVSFTTLSSGTLAVATGAALLAGQQAQALTRVDTPTAANVVGWVSHDLTNNTWEYSASYAGDKEAALTSTFEFHDTDGSQINYALSNGGRATYTFAITLDLSKIDFANLTQSEILMRGGNMSGVGINAGNDKLTETWQSGSPTWKTYDYVYPTEGLITIVHTAGNDGGYVAVYDETGTQVKFARTGDGGLRGNGNTYDFTVSENLKKAVTTMAVWATTGTLDATNMQNAAKALTYLVPSDTLVWAGTSDNYSWTGEGVWADGATFKNGNSVEFNNTEAYRTVAVTSTVAANTVAVNANYTFELTGSGSLSAQSVTVADNASLKVQGGTVTAPYTVGAGATLELSSHALGGTLALGNGARLVLSGTGTEVNKAVTVASGSAILDIEAGADAFWGANARISSGLGIQEINLKENSTLTVLNSTRANHAFNNSSSSALVVNLAAGSTLKEVGAMVGWGNGAMGTNTFNVLEGATLQLGTADSPSNEHYMNNSTINLKGGNLYMYGDAFLMIERKDNKIATTADATGMSTITGTGQIRMGNGGNTPTVNNLTGYLFEINHGNFSYDSTNTSDLRFDAGIQTGNGNKALLKTGDGILEITNANSNYSSGINVAEGTLRLTGAGTGGSGAITTAAGTLVQLNNANGTTLSEQIAGSGSVEKIGSGTVTLSGNNTYTGGTTVSAGTLVAGSAAALGDGSTVTVAAGSTLDLNAVLTIGTLTLNGSGTEGGDGAILKFMAPGSLTVTGMVVGAGTVFDLSNIAYSTTPVTLASVGTFTGNAEDVVLRNVDGQYGATLAYADSSLVLTFNLPDQLLVWDDSETNGEWSTSAANWHNEGSEEHISYPAEGADVRFTSEVTSTATLAEDIQVKALNIDGAATATISTGAGANAHALSVESVAGAEAALVLGGEGTTTVDGRVALNTLTVNSGTVELASTGATSTIATMNVSGGEASVNNATITTMTVSGGEATANDATITTLNTSGGEATVTGASTITTLNASGGTTTVAGADAQNKAGVGTLNISAANATAEFTNAEFSFTSGGDSIKGNVTIGAGARGIVTATDSLNWRSGTDITILVKDDGTLDFGNNRWTIQAHNKIVLDNGHVTGNGQSTNGTLDFDSNSGRNVLEVYGTSDATNIRVRGDNNEFHINEDSTFTITGRLNDSGSQAGGLIKTGAGELVVRGAMSYTHDTTVSEGTLTSTGTYALAAGRTLTVANGATASFSGAVTIGKGATFSVAETGTLTFGSTVAVTGDAEREWAPEDGTNGFSTLGNYATVGTGATGGTWTLNNHAATYNSTTGQVGWQQTTTTYYIQKAGTQGASDIPNTATKLVVDTHDTTDAGVVTLGDGQYTKITSLEVRSGVVSTTRHNAGDGLIHGAITVNGGATFRIAGANDATGYNGGVTSITLNGTDAANLATLDLAMTSGSETMHANLILNGNALITDSGTDHKGFNTFGGNITATGTNNVIERMQVRKGVTVTVNSGADLVVNTMENDSNGDQTRNFTKAGAGSLTIDTNTTSIATLTVNAGEMTMKSGTYSIGTLNMNNATADTVLNLQGGTVTLGTSQVQVMRGTINIGGTATMSANFDMSRDNNSSTATVRVQDGGTLDVGSYKLWVGYDANLLVDEGGTFKKEGLTMTGLAGHQGSIDITTGTTLYEATNTAFTLSHLDITATAAKTINNVLNHVVLHTGGNAVTVENSADIIDSATVEANGSLSITQGATIGGTIESKGSVALAGTVTVDALNMDQYVRFSLVDPTYSHGDNGFLTSSSQYYLVWGEGDATVTNTATIKGGSWVENPEGAGEGDLIFTFDTTPGGIYYVNTSMSYAEDADQMATATGFGIKAGATLTIPSGTTVSNKAIHGAGIYSITGTSSLGTNVTLDAADWTGAVKIGGTIANLDLQESSGLYTANSSLILDGWVGSFAKAQQTVAADVEIGDGGITINNGYSGYTTTFTGTLTGSGDIVRSDNSGVNVTPQLKFTGDVSGYIGNIINKRNHTSHGLTVTFSGDADVINAASIRNDSSAHGPLTLTFEAADTVVNSVIARNSGNGDNSINITTAADTTFNGTVNASKLTLQNGATVTFNQNAELRDGISTGAGTIVVADSKTLTLGRDAWTTPDNNFAANFIVGEGATLLMEMEQNDVKTYNGDFTFKNNSTLQKYDGGLKLTGTVTFGKNKGDIIKTAMNWGKNGFEFAGHVDGEGTVRLVGKGANDRYLFSGEGGNFSGEMQVGIKADGGVSGDTAYLDISGQNALQHGVINLAGGNKAQLRLANSQVTIGGLAGTTGSQVILKDVSAATLTISGTGTYEYAGSLAANVGLHMAGAGTQKFTAEGGVALTSLTGVAGSTVDVTGTLSLTNAGANEFNGTLAAGGLTKDGAGALTLHGISRIGSTITLAGGSLEFGSGTYDLSGLEASHQESYTEHTEAGVGYGYRTTVDGVQLVNTGDNVSAAQGVTFSFGDVTGATLLDDGVVGKTEEDNNTYYLVDGTTVDLQAESILGHTVTDVVVKDGTGTISVSEETSSLSGGIHVQDDAIAKVSTGLDTKLMVYGESTFGSNASIEVAQGSEISLNHADSVQAVLTHASGKGVITLGVDATLTNGAVTTGEGTLTVAGYSEAPVTLKLGSAEGHAIDISSFSSVVLDNGNIISEEAALTMNGLTVNNGKHGVWLSVDMDNATAHLNGVTRADGELTIANRWNAQVEIAALVGGGTFKVTGNQGQSAVALKHNADQEIVLTIDSLSASDTEKFTGDLVIDHAANANNDAFTINTGARAVEFGSLTVNFDPNHGSDLQFNVQADTAITGALTLTSGNVQVNLTNGASLTVGGLQGGTALSGLDDLTINVLEDGNYSYNGALGLTGKLVKEGPGTQTLTLGTAGSPFQINEAWELNGGTLALRGNYVLKDGAFDPEGGVTYEDVNGEYHQPGEGSGFEAASGDVTVVDITAGTLDLGSDDAKATFSYKGNTVDVDAATGKFELTGTPVYNAYYIFTDTVSLADVKEAASKHESTVLTDVYLHEGGTLSFADADTLGTLHVAATTTAGDAATLTGTGTFAVDTVTGGGTLSLQGGSLVIGTAGSGNAGLTGESDFAFDGTGTITVNGRNEAFTGDIELKGGTLKLGSSNDYSRFVLGALNIDGQYPDRTITIDAGATLDINDKADANYIYTLNGGRLTNSGAGLANGSSQTMGLIVEAESYVGKEGQNGEFWLRQSNKYTAKPILTLNADLVKQGGSDFGLYDTVVTGDGYLVVQGGALKFNDSNSSSFGANFRLAGGNVSDGKVNLTANTTIDASMNGSFSSVITGAHSVTKTGNGTLTLSGANTYSGGTNITSGTVVANNATALGTGLISVTNGGTLEVGANVTLTLASNQLVSNNGGTIVLNDGSGIKFYVNGQNDDRTYELGNVTVNGTATLNSTSSHWNAIGNIGNLSGAAGTLLNLCANASVDHVSIYNLNGTGDFKGNVEITQQSAGIRYLALNINDGAATQLQYSVVTLDSNGDANTHTGIGLGTNATVRGIVSNDEHVTSPNDEHVIFSGAAQYNGTKRVFGNDSSTVRTLTIATQEGDNFSTRAKVQKNVNLVKKGEGTQALSADTTTENQQFNGSIDVQAGTLNIMSIAAEASLGVTDVTIGAGATLGVYTGTTTGESNVGSISIEQDKVLTVGDAAQLNANLTMKEGSVMDVSAAQTNHGLNLGCSLTIEPGATLSEADMTAISGLSMENRWYYISTSVEQLHITGIGDWDATQGQQLTCEDYRHVDLDASEVYKNLAPQTYALVYNWGGENVGTVAIYYVPEPTTGTLSLLALCALAARRRRKG
ncbi:MAG: autotransporter-associated beta strand repeat-containing protein [Akkermansia sp.]|nr:autotransporter-associated beta strand repeat-containing protein [Akkermansia sp.]